MQPVVSNRLNRKTFFILYGMTGQMKFSQLGLTVIIACAILFFHCVIGPPARAGNRGQCKSLLVVINTSLHKYSSSLYDFKLLEEADLPALKLITRNPEFKRVSGELVTAKDLRWVLEFSKIDHQHSLGSWQMIYLGIREKETDEIIGYIQLGKLENNAANLGFGLKFDRWGKGIMPDAIYRSSAFAFKHLGITRIEAITRVENLGSNRVLIKLGFRLAGSGSYKDEIHNLYELTAVHLRRP
jgi:RimJ/RimL family protein N-acetyltransferase